ncbi:hypothetical protein ABFS83_05G117100 [Erythranthe nasuta]
MASFVKNKNASKSMSISSGPKSHARQPLRSLASNKWGIGKGAGGQVVLFLIKTVALEAVRRFSRAKCPVLWTGLQGLQVLCYPPLKWIQRWNCFGFLVKGMQMISRPLLVLSVVNAFTDPSDCSNFFFDDDNNPPSVVNTQVDSESFTRSPSLESDLNMSVSDENPQGLLSTDWMNNLCEELENQGITLPERFNKEELQRFYEAANGDPSSLLSSVKKTIRWRETYRILSGEELEMWSNMVFWHGLDVKNRPCLIVRLGLACTSLPSHDRPRFAQAVVSQVEHGVLHLVDGENHQISVLLDCQGLSSLKFPMQTMKYCCNLLQDHFPNVLGSLVVIRLPSVVRVIAQTLIQVLKPATKKKLRIEGGAYQKVLSECFQTLPSYLGGQCTCTRCTKFDTDESLPQILDTPTSTRESSVSDIVVAEDFPSVPTTLQYDDVNTDGYFSRTLRTAVIGILIVWVLIAFLEGLYNPESRPTLHM